MLSPSSLPGRAALLADLERAAASDGPRTVLVMFGFHGLKDYLESVSLYDGDAVLERLAGRLAQAARGAGRLYAPRRGELCALFEGELPVGWSAIPAALDAEAPMLDIRTSFALVVLPSEASSAGYALLLADTRLKAGTGTLRPGRR